MCSTMYVHKRIWHLCDLLNNIADDFVAFIGSVNVL